MKKFLAMLALCALALPPLARADTLSQEKTDDIKKLMDITGTLRFAQSMTKGITSQITNALKSRKPDIPDDVLAMVSTEVSTTITEELTAKGGYIEQVIPVFHKYLTHEEIKGLITFYNTPLGKKAISVMPMMAQESMGIGQRWAQGWAPKLDQRIRAKLAEKGITLDAPAKGGGAAPAKTLPPAGGNGKPAKQP